MADEALVSLTAYSSVIGSLPSILCPLPEFPAPAFDLVHFTHCADLENESGDSNSVSQTF